MLRDNLINMTMIAHQERKSEELMSVLEQKELMSVLEQNECLIADGFDEALIGMTHGSEPKAVYDIDQIIDILCRDDEMTREDAIEHFEFNIGGSYVGERTPVFVYCSLLHG
tara:strand:+ start:37 stop:372 length:336 start_codon:yes stop_codon:yes gene_type:complete